MSSYRVCVDKSLLRFDAEKVSSPPKPSRKRPESYRACVDRELLSLRPVMRLGGADLPPGGRERLVEMVRSGDPDQIAQAREVSIGFGLKGLDLNGSELRNADLRNVELGGSDLTFANLRNANLSGANLYDSNLYSADLRNADLIGVNLRRADLTDVNLSGANLRGAFLARTNLNDADLRGAKLAGAKLIDAKLIGADLSNASLGNIPYEADLSNILYDSTTTWPDGFTPPPSRKS